MIKMSTIPSSLQIRHNPYQNSSGVFHRNSKNNPKICIEPQDPENQQNKVAKSEGTMNPLGSKNDSEVTSHSRISSSHL